MLKNKWIKKLFIIFLFVILGFAGLSVYLTYEVNHIKEPLLAALKSQIDGELEMGSVEVQTFPVGVLIRNIRLYAPQEKTPSATIEKAQMDFDLWALLKSRIRIRLSISRPEIHLHQNPDKVTNMELIFAPLISGKKSEASKKNPLWWNHMEVSRLTIEKGHLISDQSGSESRQEIQDITIEADQILFQSIAVPAKIRIHYLLPHISPQPMELSVRLALEDETQKMFLKEGEFHWGEAAFNFAGEVDLPFESRREVALHLDFTSEAIELEKLSQALVTPIPAEGEILLKGKVEGSAFMPHLTLVADSSSLEISNKKITNFHAELIKKQKPVEIQNTHFEIFGGQVDVSGKLTPNDSMPVQISTRFKSLSLAEISGKPENPARLSGNLNLSSETAQIPNSYSGGGDIVLGPIPLPVINLEKKIKLAEILATPTGLNNRMNLGMLSSSANLIGTQIDQIRVALRISGDTITFSPFSLGNSHFSAGGSGSLSHQKSIQASGQGSLSAEVTSQLIPDVALRSALTQGKETLTVPFLVSGSVEDPSVTVDQGYLKKLFAKAAAASLKNMILGDAHPKDAVGNVLNKILNKPEKEPSSSKTPSKSSKEPGKILNKLFGN